METNLKTQDKRVRTLLRGSLIFFVCAIVFSGIYLVTGDKTPADAINITTGSMATTTPTPVVRVESFTYTTAPIHISVEYPQLVHTASSSLEEALNKRFKNDAKKIYDQSLKDLKNASRDFTAELVSGSSSEVTYDREVTFERKVEKEKTYIDAETGILSVEYSQYSDSGGAHGTFSFASETTDLNTSKELVLKDLLQGDYSKALIDEIERQIRKGEDTCVRCDTLAGELDDLVVTVPENFILSENGITFLYGAYELGSYAATSAGEEIFVSKETLTKYISRTW